MFYVNPYLNGLGFSPLFFSSHSLRSTMVGDLVFGLLSLLLLPTFAADFKLRYTVQSMSSRDCAVRRVRRSA